MKDKIEVLINEKWCKSCEICVDVCPKNVLEMKDLVAVVVNEDECTGCMLCEQLCPDFAVEVLKPEKTKKTA
ncbi:MAG: 4Fe-4S binding protein [Calditrichia bacterium]|nr:4Fe-4S binding protein [Calditrichia bacterium]